MSSYAQQPFGFSEVTQNPFKTDEFAINPEQRCPCVLLLDTSSSMGGQPIAQLNSGLLTFKRDLLEDSLAAKRVEVAIVTFGPARVVQDFVSASTFAPQHLSAGGGTPMGAAILEGIGLVERRKQTYQEHGIPYNRPWIFLITDGAPTDDIAQAAALLKNGVERKKFAFFAVGVEGADMSALAGISPRAPVKLAGLKFSELFQWLSNSLGTASRSTPSTDRLALPPPSGWAEL